MAYQGQQPPPAYGQPPPVQQTVVIQQPVVMTGNPMAAPQNVREFSTGLFGCFEDIGSCCCGYFFPCCMWISIANRLNESCCVPVCLQGGTFALRTKFRTLYGIKGSICNDCMALACCGACATCQLDREMKHMGL